MKADLSRLRLAPAKHDEAWLEQQGRVRLDSDHNEAELARLLLDRLQSSDVVGGCGVPEPGHGFQIVTDVSPSVPTNFHILGGTGSRGHFYVDGVLCRSELDRTYLDQAGELPFPPPIPLPVGVPAAGVAWNPAPGWTGVSRNRPMSISLLDGSVLVVGGYNPGSGLTVQYTEVYKSGVVTTVGPLATSRVDAAMVRLPDGRVLITGGYSVTASGSATTKVPVNSCEIYDPTTQAWTAAAPMASARALHTAVLAVNGKVLVAGGDDGSGPIAGAEIFDGSSWTATPQPLDVARMQHVSAALPNGRVLVAGGQIPKKLFTADSVTYDFPTNAWQPAGKLSEPKAEASCTVLGDNRVLVAGGVGVNTIPLASADVYEQGLNAWRPAAPMPVGRFGHGAALMLDGTVLVHTGTVAAGTPLTPNSAVIFDPATSSKGQWSTTASSTNARYPSQAILLPDGTVLAIGGNAYVVPEVYQPKARGLSVVYLETWRRLVTQHQDPSILESALDGTDTTARLRNVAQVKVVAVDESQYPAGVTCSRATAYLPGPGNGTLSVVAIPPQLNASDCELPDPGSYTGRENRLYRVEIHDGGNVFAGQGQTPPVVLSVPVTPPSAEATELDLPSGSAITADQAVALIGHRWDLVETGSGRRESISIIDAQGSTISLGAPILRTYTASTTIEQPDRTFPLTAAASQGDTTLHIGPGQAGPPYLGKWLVGDGTDDESVDVVALGQGTVTLAVGVTKAHGLTASLKPGDATFKWSRSNAAFAAEAKIVDTQTLQVNTLGQDAASVLRIGDLVEVIGDGYELSFGRGQLYHVVDVKTDPTLAVVLDAPLDSILAMDSNLLLRRWDGFGRVSSTFVSGVATPDLDLGEGVHIEFGGWDLRPGDFWWFTTRAINGEVEVRTNAPPDGIERHACPLALIRWRGDDQDHLTLEAIDCRTTFDPLTGLQARHVEFDDTVCAMGAVTVQEALDDICGRFNAADISYHANCLGLAAATTVQEALDLLCEGAQSKWPTITDVGWPNDGVYEMNSVNQGLSVTTSEPMIPATTTVDTFRVVIDLPYNISVLYGGSIGQAPTAVGPTATPGAIGLPAVLGIPSLAAAAVPTAAAVAPTATAPTATLSAALSPAAAATPAAAAPTSVPTAAPVSTVSLTPGLAADALTAAGAAAPAAGPVTPTAAGTVGAIAGPSLAAPIIEAGGGVPNPFALQRLASELYGFVKTTDKQIVFTPQPQLNGPTIEQLFTRQHNYESVLGITHAPGLRMRVTLKGDDILAVAGQNPPLDGEVMGQLDSSGVRIDFARDSSGQIRGGNGIEGGNFESWFFVAVPPRVNGVSPMPLSVIAANQGPVTSVTVYFTKPIDVKTITTASFLVLDPAGNPVPLTSVQFDPASPYWATLTLTQGLIATLSQPKQTYTIVLLGIGRTPVRDTVGLALDGTNQYRSGSDFRSTFLLRWPLHATMTLPSTNTGLLTLSFDRPISPNITSANVAQFVPVNTPPVTYTYTLPFIGTITVPIMPTPSVTLVNQQTIQVQNGGTIPAGFVGSGGFVTVPWGKGTTTVGLVNVTDADGFPLLGNQADGITWSASFTE